MIEQRHHPTCATQGHLREIESVRVQAVDKGYRRPGARVRGGRSSTCNVKLAIWLRQGLSRDTGLPVGHPNPTDLSLGHNVASKAEVDAVMAQAQAAGAVIIKPAHDTFWGGYAGYFQDPDQHLWEIVWNPQLLPTE